MNPTDLAAAWLALTEGLPGAGEIRLSSLDAANNTGHLLVGSDSHQRLHLLVPVPPGHPVRVDRRSKGVGIERNEYVVGADRRPFVDVVCYEPALNDIFHRLAAEMVTRVVDKPADSVSVCQEVLARWRELLERRRPPLSPDALAGLFGELHVLSQLVARDPAHRVGAWVGPTGAVHDFQTATVEVEVKATARREGRLVGIHGAEQLQPTGDRELYLLFIRFRIDTAGRSVGDLVASLKSAGVDGIQLDELVALSGWSESVDDERFVVVEERLYRVDDAFPKIVPDSFTEGDVPSGVVRLQYEVDLTGPQPAPLGGPAASAVLDDLAGVS